MASESKHTAYASDFEVDSRDLHLQAKVRALRLVDNIRIGVTSVALLMGVTILGLSANTLSVYSDTHVGSDFFLPLWPDQFDLQPTIALVVGSTVVFLANTVSLVSSKVHHVRDSVVKTRQPIHPFPSAIQPGC